MFSAKIKIAFAFALIGQTALAHGANAQSADIAAGQKRAEVCMACHGEKGRSQVPGIPHLAGQDRDYLVAALNAYRAGNVRTDPTMVEMAKPLTDKDIENLAAFWSSLGSVVAVRE